MAGATVPEPSDAERARTLVETEMRGALSTLSSGLGGWPFGSVVNYAVDGRGRPAFFVSTLAEHTRNLEVDPRASLLVVADVPRGADPLAAARVTLIGEVAEVTDPDERAAARAGYLAALPSALYVDYADFQCLRLEVTGVRWVGGFGRMSWIEPDDYAAASADPLASAATAIIGHMNTDHADALVTLSHHWGGRPDVVRASMSAVDRYGFEVVAETADGGREALRIGFRSDQVDAEGVRAELIGMLRDARQGTNR